MTYEVRAALRLPQDAAGVVVARVEPGSPAAQTRIGKNELIQEVEGRHVVDVATFVALLEEARTQGKENVRVVVRRLDKTRLVDLGLAPKDIPGDVKPGDIPPDAPVDQPPRDR
jgi:S1-C subfamily serine protease